MPHSHELLGAAVCVKAARKPFKQLPSAIALAELSSDNLKSSSNASNNCKGGNLAGIQTIRRASKACPNLGAPCSSRVVTQRASSELLLYAGENPQQAAVHEQGGWTLPPVVVDVTYAAVGAHHGL